MFSKTAFLIVSFEKSRAIKPSPLLFEAEIPLILNLLLQVAVAVMEVLLIPSLNLKLQEGAVVVVRDL